MTRGEKTPLWRSIAQALQADINAGLYAAGQKLPTEAALALRFGVNRHTVRAAIAHLAERNIVHTRRGAGVFVAQVVADYPLGPRVRFHQNIAATGRLPSRQITRAETLPCSAAEAVALGLPLGAAVHVIEGVSLADAQPLALFRSVFPARLTGLLAALQAHSSVTVALAACGVLDYTRRETRITAHLADGLQALALHIPQGAPLLRTIAINDDSAGGAVEYGLTWFAADRVALVLTGRDDLSQIRGIPTLGAEQKG